MHNIALDCASMEFFLSHSFEREAGTYKLDHVFCKSRLHRLIHGQIILPLL